MSRANISPILLHYMIRHLAVRIALAVVVVLAIFMIIDMAELYRRLSGREIFSLTNILALSGMKIPSLLPQIIPFGLIIGAIASFNGLRLNNEIIIARTSGLSQIKLSVPSVVVAVAMAILMLLVIDPIASATSKRHEAIEAKIFGTPSRGILSVSTEGIWLFDHGENLSLIINGDAIGQEGDTISNPTVYRFDDSDQITRRYYPETLTLDEGAWQMEGGQLMDGDGILNPMRIVTVPTELTQRELLYSNKKPETIPVFELWGYIKVLRNTGLPSLGHSSYLYAQLSTPLVFIGLMLIIARIMLGASNRKGWFQYIAIGFFGGLLLYFIKDLFYVMGSSGRIPPLIAGFAPGVLMLCLGITMLIRADEN